jgi:hypothetical protein
MATNRDDSAVARRPAEGEMGTPMRTYDWQRTPLGPPDGWPAESEDHRKHRSIFALCDVGRLGRRSHIFL